MHIKRNDNEKSIAVTVDVESDWGGRADTCHGMQEGLPFVLNILKRFDIKATFFISGEVIANNKDMICEIKKSGHEIASHSFKHNMDYGKLSKEELFNQINRSKELIEDEIGVKPVGFRTPQFRINDYLFDVLSDLGFKYDSSMVRGILPTRYSGLSIPSEPFFKNGILEIPISTMPYIRVPMGLLWINAMGVNMFRFLLKRAKSPNPITLYLHPFDLLQTKSKSNFGFFVTRWYNYKSHSTKKTLELLIKYWDREDGRFITVKELLQVERNQNE